MAQNQRRLFCFAGAMALFLMSGSLSFAYIPPSQFILKTWVNRHVGPKAMRLKLTVTGYKDKKPTNLSFKEVAMVNLDTGVFKSAALNEADHKLFSTNMKLPAMSALTQLLFNKNLPDVAEALKKQGIPIRTEAELLAMKTEEERLGSEVQSLSRSNGLPAWVIGKEAQLWFQKDAFQPLVFKAPSEKDGQTYEYRMEGFGENFPYPRTLTVLDKSGEILLESRLQDLTVVSEAMITKGISGKVEDENSESSSGEIQSGGALKELIQTYYNVVR